MITVTSDIRSCFISIPITGQEETARNICAETKRRLSEKYPHIHFVTPFEVNMKKDMPDSYYMGRDIEALMNCDAIISMEGWQKSKGCQVERFTANIYGLKIFDIKELLSN